MFLEFIKRFSSLFEKKHFLFLIVFFFITFGLLLPLRPAQAFIIDLALNVASGLAAIVLQIVLAATNLFLIIASVILSWATGPGFISLPYTKGGIVDIGWGLTRDLANMGFVIALVAIGLGTALRMGEYEAKKALPTLIGIALLINFTPVIMGVIVDASNIAMNFFLEGTTSGKNFVDLAIQQKDIVGKAIGNFFKPTDLTPLAQTIVLIVFSVLTGTFLLLYAVLFIARYVAIWVLVILSPIAFFCYVLPATRGVFKTWWSQFIQWCLIGVTSAFFLYLADQLIAESLRGGGFAAPVPGTGIPGVNAPFYYTINNFLPHLVSLTLLFIGFFVALSSSAMGSSAFIAGAKKMPGWMGKRGTSLATTTTGRRILPKFEGLGQRLARLGEEPDKEKGRLAKVGGIIGRTPGVGHIGRWAGRGIAAGSGRLYREVKTSDENEINAGKKEATNKDAADNLRIINEELTKGPLTNWNRIVGVLNGMVANGDTNDIQDYLRTGKLDAKNVGQALLRAQRGGPPSYRPIAKAMYGRLLSNPEEFGKEFSVAKRDADGIPTEFNNSDVNRMVREVPEKIKPGEITDKIFGDTIDIGKTDGEEFEKYGGKMVIQQLVKTRGGDLLSTLVRRPETREGREEIMKVIRGFDPTELHRIGADGVVKFLNSSAAQGAGIVSPLTPHETDELLELLREKDERALTTDEENKLQKHIGAWRGGRTQPMPFKTIEIATEVQQRQAELSQITAQRAATPPFHTTQQQQRMQQLQNEMNQLNQDLQREKDEEQIIDNISKTRRVRNLLRDKYQQQYRSRIQDQLKREASFLQASAAKTRKPLQDVTGKRIQELLLRALDAEEIKGRLPRKITAKDERTFQQVVDDPTRVTTDSKELAGALNVLSEKIRAAEERINTTPRAPQAEWRELNRMKTRYKEIRIQLGKAGVNLVP